MKYRGMLIYDSDKGKFIVQLPDILKEIKNGDSLHWSILSLDAIGNLGDNISIGLIQEKIKISKYGFLIDWNTLNDISFKFKQIFDGILIGCRDEKLVHIYDTEQEMYET